MIKILAICLTTLFITASSCPTQTPPEQFPEISEGGAVPILIDKQWLADTSLASGQGPCIQANQPLYRGNRDAAGRFTLKRWLLNMIGDETAESPSWAMTKLIENDGGGPITAERWRVLKNTAVQAFKIPLNLNDPIFESDLKAWKKTDMSGQDWLALLTKNCKPLEFCIQSACYSEFLTFEDKTGPAGLALKKHSWGIAFISLHRFDIATKFARGSGSIPGESVVVEIKERIARAAVTTFTAYDSSTYGINNEWYDPIVVPAADITRAWSGPYVGGPHAHILEKVESPDREKLLKVQIFTETELPTLPSDPHGDLEGCVIACATNGPCVSDALPTSPDLELEQVIAAIPAGKINGYRFKFVNAKNPLCA